MTSRSILVLSPPDRCDPQVPIAAVRAGEVGVLDLGFSEPLERRRHAICQLDQLARGRGRWAVRCDLLGEPSRLSLLVDLLRPIPAEDRKWPVLFLAGVSVGEDELLELIRIGRQLADEILLEVYSPSEALLAQQAGADGVILKGYESGGRVSEQSVFLLLQHARDRLQIPYWVQGGIGPDTAAAAYLGGAAGVVLGEQLWMADESPFSQEERKHFELLDGSETICLSDGQCHYRLFNRAARDVLKDLEKRCVAGSPWREALVEHLLKERPERALEGDAGSRPHLLPMGQEISLAANLARTYRTVGGILNGYRKSISDNLRLAKSQQALAAASPLAQLHGTKYPIVQGPMTRVSDVAAFCKSVAENGGLPFLALAMMRGPDVRRLLTEVRDQLGDLTWGAGILGFVPPELRNEQLEVVHDIRPGYALVAGGRPSQAQRLEEVGIPTYLHVPSRGLLESFIRDGARKFVFEGRECGGHVGPQSSFSLWQSAIRTLNELDDPHPEEFQILFAGGIHDGFSAAMVATAAAPLVDRGMKIGVLMGTGYLFTHEAVECGAITEEFQRQAIACADTALVETSLGHATRCARTQFVTNFDDMKRALMLQGASPEEISSAMDMFNLGRLRIAAKGLMRKTASSADSSSTAGEAADRRQMSRSEQVAELSEDPSQLVSVDVNTQRQNGMYMIGEVATLRSRVISMAELHADVCDGGNALLERLAARQLPWQSALPRRTEHQDLAIVGIGCMFPQSPDLRTYWQNIVNGFDAVTEIPPERWRTEDFFSEDRFAPDRLYSKWGSFLGDVVFDPLKYRIPPNSLRSIEPIQLLALEVASEALRDAGYGRPDFPCERTSVIFAAAGSHDHAMRYAFRAMMRQYLPQAVGLTDAMREEIYASLDGQLPEWTEDSFPGFLMNVIAGRIANRFNLGGTNFTVDAACAASLAALQTGAEQLRAGICDAALIGAVDGTNNPFCYMCFSKTQALSPGGRSRPFDATADGIGLGEGVAALVLKRLADAERDGNVIYAVIKGIGSSSDGRNRSLTAPYPPGQLLALNRAYADADIRPASISLLEAHSTGTTVGDRVEAEALLQVLKDDHASAQSCAIGSVKSMIGHTKTAAGLASLIKTTLALGHRVIPPTIGVERPSDLLRDQDSPIYVNTETRPWLVPRDRCPRRAGVSAFGFGGTNFHVVLEEYVDGFHAGFDLDLNPRPCEVFAWSRPSREQLLECIDKLIGELSDARGGNFAELAFAVFCDEKNNRASPSHDAKCRLAIVADSQSDLYNKLRAAADDIRETGKSERPGSPIYSEAHPASPDSVCFLFPGQGSQSVNMLTELVAANPKMYDLFERADEAVAEFFPKPLSQYIYPVPVFERESADRCKRELSDTRVAQPALAVVDLFCCDLLARFGISPALVAGHSFGEYVALAAAGVFSRSDLFWLAASRGRAVHEAGREKPGAMAAVVADAATTQAALHDLNIEARVANRNAADQTVVAGPVAEIDRAVAMFPEKKLRIRKLAVSAAFHTPDLTQAASDLGALFHQVTFHPAEIPVFSNTIADVYPPDTQAMRDLLVRHMVEPVRFDQQVHTMYGHGARIFIESGPGGVLTGLVSRNLADKPHTSLAFAGVGQTDWSSLGKLLARLIALGLPVKLDAWFQNRRLTSCGTEDWSRRAAESKQPKLTDWIVNSNRSEPLRNAAPGRDARPAGPSNEVVPIAGGEPASNEETSAARGSPEKELIPPGNEGGRQHEAASPPVPHVPTAASLKQPRGLHLENDSASNSGTSHMNNGNPEQRSAGSHLAQGQRAAPRDAIAPDYAMPHDGQTAAYWYEMFASNQRVMEGYLDMQKAVLGHMGFPVGNHHPKPPAAGRPSLPPPSSSNNGVVGPRLARPFGRMSSPQPDSQAPRTEFSESARSAAGSMTTAPAAAARPSPPPTGRGQPAAAEPSTPEPTPPLPASIADPSAPATSVADGTTSAAAEGGRPTTEQFRKDLLEAISERTGYPTEMLKEDALLEADLGIDSIKTLEIFGSLTQYHQYLPGGFGGDEERLSEFSQLKTIGAIVASYDKTCREAPGSPPEPSPAQSESSRGVEAGQADAPLQRLAVKAVAAPVSEQGEKKNSHSNTSS